MKELNSIPFPYPYIKLCKLDLFRAPEWANYLNHKKKQPSNFFKFCDA